MKDILGTLFGLLIGATLVIAGIVWPDYLSNYYLFQLREFEITLETLNRNGAAIEQIRAHQAGFQAFMISGDFEQKIMCMAKAERMMSWTPKARPAN